MVNLLAATLLVAGMGFVASSLYPSYEEYLPDSVKLTYCSTVYHAAKPGYVRSPSADGKTCYWAAR
jgi:hypothetical protein